MIDTDGTNQKQLTQTANVYNWFPSRSPDRTQITFSSNRSGKYQLSVMNVDGSNQRALAFGCVSWFSPNGNQIIFSQYCTDSGNIWLMQAGGDNARAITDAPFDNNRNPSWSPDGTKIVFQSEQTGNFEIWVMNVDGSNATQLTFDPAMDAAPVWQPIP